MDTKSKNTKKLNASKKKAKQKSNKSHKKQNCQPNDEIDWPNDETRDFFTYLEVYFERSMKKSKKI